MVTLPIAEAPQLADEAKIYSALLMKSAWLAAGEESLLNSDEPLVPLESMLFAEQFGPIVGVEPGSEGIVVHQLGQCIEANLAMVDDTIENPLWGDFVRAAVKLIKMAELLP